MAAAAKTTQLFNTTCLGLAGVQASTVHAIITDPPYGINYQNNEWDKTLPPAQIWRDCYKVLKPGGYAAVFGAVRLMHRLMVQLEEAGFVIKDVLMWGYLNGMPKSRDIALAIDKELNTESAKIGEYKYVQGYKKGGAENYSATKGKAKLTAASKIGKQFAGSGVGIKPAYEPIILVQKPLDPQLSIAQNMIAHGTGALNLEDTRIPYEAGEGKVGHNPHPRGRVAANVLRTEAFNDGYDKYFLVPKVRQHADDYNTHPTIKPVQLMQHIVQLLSWPQQLVLDPFMGSGSTGVACTTLHRAFIGYELHKEYYEVARKRMATT